MRRKGRVFMKQRERVDANFDAVLVAIEFYHLHSVSLPSTSKERTTAVSSLSMQHLGTFNIECSKNKTSVSVRCPVAYGNHRLTLLLRYTSEIPLDVTYFNALTHAILHAEVRVVVWDLLFSLTSRSSGSNYTFARISTKKQPSSKHLPKVPSRFILPQNM